MPTETCQFRSQTVEIVQRYNFKDAVKVRSRSTGAEMIVSAAELAPHRTRAQFFEDRKAARNREWNAFLTRIENSIRGGHHNITGLADNLYVSRNYASKGVAALERAGRVVWDRSKRNSIRIA